MQKKESNLHEFLKFAATGVGSTFLYLAVYYLSLNVIKLPPQVANFIGFIISLTCVYFFNLIWVFKTKNTKAKIIKYFLSNFLTYLLGSGLLYLWVDILSINANIAPLLNTFIVIPTNYFLAKIWAMK